MKAGSCLDPSLRTEHQKVPRASPIHDAKILVSKDWMRCKDEYYSKLRGPAENMTILATAADTPDLKNAGCYEPMLMMLSYKKSRVFHTTLGHDTEAFQGVGFIVTFLRGSEWAATGKATQEIQQDFPAADKASARNFELKK